MNNCRLLVLLCLLFFSACNNSEKNTDFDKGPMLENLAFNLAIPAYEHSLHSFHSLDSSLQILKKNHTEENLIRAQEFWKKASIGWAKTSPYNFGPIDDLLIENNFHYFPIDSTKLKSALENFNGDDDFINKLGSNSRGLGALEFLLFSESITLDENNIAFAEILSHNLVKLNQEILDQWKSDYAKTFASSTGSNINASITILSNQWIELAEKIKNDKIGVPAGKMAGEEHNIYAVQAPYSQISLALIKANLEALQQSINGKEGKGVDDYLNSLDIKDSEGKLLSSKINAQFDLIISLIEEKQSLKDLIKEDSESLNETYLQVLNLTILLKTDMMSQLGLITTFSDSDGD